MVEKVKRSIFGVLLPPLAVFLEKGVGFDFWLDIVFTLLGYVPGIIFCFHCLGMKLLTNLLCFLLPFVAVFMQYKCSAEFYITLLLTMLLWLPGVIMAYFLLS